MVPQRALPSGRVRAHPLALDLDPHLAAILEGAVIKLHQLATPVNGRAMPRATCDRNGLPAALGAARFADLEQQPAIAAAPKPQRF